MDFSSLKTKKRSCWANLEFVGLCAAGAPAINGALFHGGKYTLQTDGTPRTGQVVLLVHQGGLRERTIAATVKELFRKDVMPVLAEAFPDVDLKYCGALRLNFNEGILTNFNMVH